MTATHFVSIRFFVCAFFACAAAVAFAPTKARAQNEYVVPEERIESVRGMALGSGLRASAASSHALIDNVANLPIGGLYHLSAQAGYNAAQKRTTAGATVVDSMTSKLAAGIGARGFFGEGPAGEHKGWEGRLGLGLPVTETVRLGLAGRYSRFRISDSGARPHNGSADGGAPDQTYRLRDFTMDAAVAVSITAGIQLAALGYNLIKTDSPLAPQQVGGSLSFAFDALTFGGDALVDLSTFDKVKLLAGGGVEYFAQSTFPLRLGYQFDQGRSHHFVTGGLGYVDQRVAIQMAVRQRVGSDTETRLLATAQYSMR